MKRNPYIAARERLISLSTSIDTQSILERAPDDSGFLEHADEIDQFLLELNYVRKTGGNDTIFPTADDICTTRNRLALLNVAAKFEQAFLLPMPDAPGASFFGAMVDPLAYEIDGHDRIGSGGRGTTLRQSFESCVGEAAEYLSFIEREDDDLLHQIDGDHELPPAYRDWLLTGVGIRNENEMAGRDWMKVRSLADDKVEYFPSELIIRRGPRNRKGARIADSTGLGAGPTLLAAAETALYEVIERDAVALWWYGGNHACSATDYFAVNEALHGFVESIRAASSREYWILDITSDLGIPVIAALSAESNGQAVVAGFSAHLDPVRAIQGAILELCQMELGQAISISRSQHVNGSQLNEQDLLWVRRYNEMSVENFPRFTATHPGRLRSIDVLQGGLASVVDRLYCRGYQVFLSDLTRPELDIPVARVLVPNLQSVKPDWISKRLARVAGENGRSLNDIDSLLSPI